MDFATEEIKDGGEAPDVLGRAGQPKAFAFGGRAR